MLERYPKSSIDVYLLVLESESPDLETTLAAGLSVASAGLVDAGVEVKGLGVGVVGAGSSSAWSSARFGTGEATGAGDGKTPLPPYLLDPTPQESRASQARVTVGTLPALGLVTDIWMTGEMDVGGLSDVSYLFPSHHISLFVFVFILLTLSLPSPSHSEPPTSSSKGQPPKGPSPSTPKWKPK